ncbi:hypothetical protein E3P99_02969 [Wallemia hederae]|uniref:Elongation factor 1-gamma n=1 Tax=Wallemia hederae TaxID=1540922 RepID=A0A4T0FJH1_9BASI|nr:hypothetical protein E3P99_02969 [Wallemia hederae]
MTSVGTIYTYPNSHRVVRALSVAKLNGLQVDVPAFNFGTDNQTPEFIEKFPSGQVPAFESADKKFHLTQGAAIAWYLASLNDANGLLGKSPQDAALIQQWVAFAEADLFIPLSQPAYMNLGYLPFNKQQADTAFVKVEKALTTLQSVLEKRTFLVGERITLADVTVASILRFGLSSTVDSKLREKFPHVVRFYKSVAHNATISDVFGKTDYLDTFKLNPPKKDDKKTEKKQEKKQEKPKEAAAPAAAAEAPAAPPAEKPKHPLDLLPKSSFNLENFKRVFSNYDTRGDDPSKHSLAFFYKEFVPEDYTIVKFAFKYQDELTMTFMSNNQIGGFFTRLEASRKYMMGTGIVINDTSKGGVEGASEIVGVFICRGSDYLNLIQAAPDWESYEYTPLDLNKPEDKEFFEGVMAWDLKKDGKECIDGKLLK